METWSIAGVRADQQTVTTHDLLLSYLTSVAAWRRLSKPARAAVEAAYPDDWIACHPLTRKALQRHGFIIRDHPTGWRLTDAGRAVFRWVSKPCEIDGCDKPPRTPAEARHG